MASETFVLVWRKRQWVERVNELLADWWNSNIVRQVLDMLHITQPSVERGLDFNQISLIQDKIRQFFFFFIKKRLCSQTLRAESPKVLLWKERKLQKFPIGSFSTEVNRGYWTINFTPYSSPQYITILSKYCGHLLENRITFA